MRIKFPFEMVKHEDSYLLKLKTIKYSVIVTYVRMKLVLHKLCYHCSDK